MSAPEVEGRVRAVRRRRRTVVLVGTAMLILASATACIFDKGGDYQGGGRLDKGATAKAPDPSAIPTATDTTTPPDQDSAVPNPLVPTPDASDAADGG